jgi:hypothetical protein
MNQPIRMTRTVLLVLAVAFCFTGVAAAEKLVREALTKI